VSSEFALKPPSVDVPSLTVRWEGLVVAIDGTTLTTILRKATRKVPEIQDILVEPEDGRLGITVRVKKGIKVPLRSHLTSLRLKDGLLGFAIADLTVFGFVPIPNWILRKIIDRQPPGRAFFYPDERIVVINLASVLPHELSVVIREVVCENGEMRFVFGPSQYRLDRIIEEMGADPFAEE
jgi:hypothetical protein